MHARGALVLDRMRAQPVVEHRVGALADEPVVERSQHRPERIRVVDRPRAVAVGGAQAIAHAPRQRALEEPAGVPPRQVREQRAVGGHGVERVGARDVRAKHRRAGDVVEAEHGERVAVAAFDDRFDRAGEQGA